MSLSVSILLIPHLLPHLYLLHNHLRLFPSGKPLIFSINEIFGGCSGLINPRFPTLSILKPAIRATHGDIQDEIEFLIKGCIDATCRPRVLDTGTVGSGGDLELASGPEILNERTVEDLQKAGIDVGEEIFFGPLDAESVLGGREGGVEGVALDVGAIPGVAGLGGAPM